MSNVTFAGRALSTFGAECFFRQIDNSTKHEYIASNIPGRNGALITSQGYRNNVSHTYDVIIHENAEANMTAFRSYMSSIIGYARLSDDIKPNEFYMAYISRDIVPEFTPDRSMAKAVIEFSRKPQRFLVSGESVTSLTETGVVSNPTLQEAKPLLRVYGTGSFGIGNITVTITEADSYTDIDCDIMEAYKGATSKNAYVQVTGLTFPVLKPGNNNVVLGSGITRIDITPRWYEL